MVPSFLLVCSAGVAPRLYAWEWPRCVPMQECTARADNEACDEEMFLSLKIFLSRFSTSADPQAAPSLRGDISATLAERHTLRTKRGHASATPAIRDCAPCRSAEA